MASNAAVDKMKAFGLQHGEKVAMGATALIFAVCAYFAWSHPSIDVTPDEVQDTAKKANANITAQQKMDTIIAKLADQGVKVQDFEKKVDIMQSGSVDVAKYKLLRPFVTPEPGAGLIRDMPEFLAPSKLFVHANRGAVRVIALNDDGTIKKKEDPKENGKKNSKKSSKTASRSGFGTMPGMGGGTKKQTKGTSSADLQKKKDDDEAARRKEKMIAGTEDVGKKDEDKPVEEEVAMSAADAETELTGFRFINIVGQFDHAKQKEKYAHALKEDAASAAPNYLGLDVERQEKKGDNSWSEWKKVNREIVADISTRLSKREDELVPTESQISTLIDPIPFLEVGYLVGAHPAALLPKSLLTRKKAEAAKGGVADTNRMSKMGGGNQFTQADYDRMGKSGKSSPGGGDYASGLQNSMNSDFGQNTPAAGAGGGTGPRGPSGGDFEKTNADAVMLRALDYDVFPDAVYRYRVRIIFANPNLNWETVAPGVDNKSPKMYGGWSPVTEEVNVPPDVATYAQGKTPAAANIGGNQFEFQVVAWNEEDGITVVHKFDQSPGSVIGGPQTISLPDPKQGKQLKPRQIDFTSHQILADASGGDRPVSQIQPLGSNRLEVPVTALVIRADGMLVLRDEAKDATSGEFAEMREIFERYKKDVTSSSKKESSTMMGPMGGGAGGGGTRKGGGSSNN